MNSEFTVAVHSLALLAYLPERMASSDYIARNVATNPTRIRKVMGSLREKGFVKTKEGIGGGYMLNCDPDILTLADIYRTMSEGTLKPHWCSGNPEEECVISANMQHVMDQFFTEAEQHYVAYLEKSTLSTVIDRLKLCQQQHEGERNVK